MQNHYYRVIIILQLLCIILHYYAKSLLQGNNDYRVRMACLLKDIMKTQALLISEDSWVKCG